jgi:hypothetical protein
LSILDSALGTHTGDAGYDNRADFNDDGAVDSTDLSLLEDFYLTSGDS